MTWRVELDAGARKDMRAIRDARMRGRILRELQKLEAEPRPADAKRLVGHAGLWRLRVGDWRIAYAVRDEMVLVLVVAVGTRGEIYEMVRRRAR
jgi:mRNA interferase RelE/StbE